jgi:hypothetical protein
MATYFLNVQKSVVLGLLCDENASHYLKDYDVYCQISLEDLATTDEEPPADI